MRSRLRGPLERALWGVYGRLYDSLLGFRPYRDLVEILVTAADVRPGSAVLDVGCGTGNVLVEVLAREATAEVTGVDLSTAMLRRAEAKLPGRRLVLEDACAFLNRVPDESFDRVVCSNVAYAVTDRSQLWREILRVLRSDGIAIISTPTRGGNRPIIREHLRYEGLTSLLRPGLVGVFIIDSLISFVGNRGHFSFVPETQVLLELEDAGAKVRWWTRCYGGAENGVNIAVSIEPRGARCPRSRHRVLGEGEGPEPGLGWLGDP